MIMSVDLESLGERIATHAAHLDAATHTLLTDLREFDAAGGWYKQGARSCADWLSWRVGWNMGTAREHLRVARRLAELPLIDDALRRGSISYVKVRAITRVATPANEATLLTDAQYSTGSQLERICRKYAAVVRASKEPDEAYDRDRRYLRRFDLDDGMVKIDGVFHPEEAAAIWAALEAVARARTSDRAATTGDGAETPGTNGVCAGTSATLDAPSLGAIPKREREARFDRADALVSIARAVLRGDRVHAVPTELVVTVAAETLVNPLSAPDPFAVTSDGTCVSAETARRLACDCGVVHMVEDASGTTVSVGRKTRSIPASMKRALLKRDTTCRFPGCCNRIYVEGHHIHHWANGGETSLGNLIGLCSHHHRFVHEYGYRVELDELQQPRFFDHHDRLVTDAPPRPAPRRLGMQALVDRHRELDVSAETNEPLWDGDPVNYPWVIGDLVRVDGLH